MINRDFPQHHPEKQCADDHIVTLISGTPAEHAEYCIASPVFFGDGVDNSSDLLLLNTDCEDDCTDLSSNHPVEIDNHSGESALPAIFSDKTAGDSLFYDDEAHLPALFSSSMAHEAYYYGADLSLLRLDDRRASGIYLSSREIENLPLWNFSSTAFAVDLSSADSSLWDSKESYLFQNSHCQVEMAISQCQNPHCQVEMPISPCENSHCQVEMQIPPFENSHCQVEIQISPCENPHCQVEIQISPCENSHCQVEMQISPCENSHCQVEMQIPPFENPHCQVEMQISPRENAYCLPKIENLPIGFSFRRAILTAIGRIQSRNKQKSTKTNLSLVNRCKNENLFEENSTQTVEFMLVAANPKLKSVCYTQSACLASGRKSMVTKSNPPRRSLFERFLILVVRTAIIWHYNLRHPDAPYTESGKSRTKRGSFFYEEPLNDYCAGLLYASGLVVVAVVFGLWIMPALRYYPGPDTQCVDGVGVLHSGRAPPVTLMG